MKRILIVDDNADERKILEDLLKAEGFDTTGVADGEQALDLLGKQKIDMILADRAMPGMGGMDLLRKLHEQKVALPVIMISGYGEERLWGEAIGLGAKDYLLKPIRSDVVVQVVRKYLGGGVES